MKDKSISHTDGFSVLVAAQSSAKQPSKFAQAPESFRAATENWVGSYKTPASGSISWPWLGEEAAVEMWQQPATDAATLPSPPPRAPLLRHFIHLCQASISELEKHILKKKPRQGPLNECFLKPLQIHFQKSDYTSKCYKNLKLYTTEQNKDRPRVCTHYLNYSDPADLYTNCICFQNSSYLHLEAINEKFKRLCLTDHLKITWGKLVVI